MDIRVVRVDGSRVSFARFVFLRWLPLAIVGCIPFVGGIVALIDPLLIFRESRRCLHDDIADTQVVTAASSVDATLRGDREVRRREPAHDQLLTPPGTARSLTLDTTLLAETPEGIAILLRPAGAVPRALAYALDLFIRFVVWAVAAALLGAVKGVGVGVMLIVLFALEWIYPIVFELLPGAATPGKRVARAAGDDGHGPARHAVRGRHAQPAARGRLHAGRLRLRAAGHAAAARLQAPGRHRRRHAGRARRQGAAGRRAAAGRAARAARAADARAAGRDPAPGRTRAPADRASASTSSPRWPRTRCRRRLRARRRAPGADPARARGCSPSPNG